MPSDARTGEVLDRLAVVARAVDTGSVHETLQQIVELAVTTVPGCEHATISIAHGRKLTTPAASDDAALRLDAVQHEVGEGPCLDAITDAESFHTDDLERETRWPLFSKRAAAETGIASVLAIRLFARGKTLGALNLLSTRKGAFDEEAIAIAALFATVASIALNAATTEEGLEVALRNRDVIGRAKGILMERHQITDEEAFGRLASASQRMNVRLVRIAEQVAESGEDVGGDDRQER